MHREKKKVYVDELGKSCVYYLTIRWFISLLETKLKEANHKIFDLEKEVAKLKSENFMLRRKLTFRYESIYLLSHDNLKKLKI